MGLCIIGGEKGSLKKKSMIKILQFIDIQHFKEVKSTKITHQ